MSALDGAEMLEHTSVSCTLPPLLHISAPPHFLLSGVFPLRFGEALAAAAAAARAPWDATKDAALLEI
ncbi:MAG: hypothetical protein ABJI23_00825 [Marinobacter sp.]|uniref:hypothetical protein n=1 Tax=Marinobacter sp. TaxID=50741 RepID=UPI003298A0B3